MRIEIDPTGHGVFMDDAGNDMGTRDGILAIMSALGMETARELGEVGGWSKRTVQHWLGGRRPSDAAMNVFMRELAKRSLIVETAPKRQ